MNTDAILYAFFERLAIVEHDGKCLNADEVKQAFYDTARLYGVEPRNMPQEAKEEMRKAVASRLS